MYQQTFSRAFSASLLCLSLFAGSIGLASAAGGSPPNGKYNCHKISSGHLIHIGTLEINGSNYRGLADGEGSFAPYSVGSDGSLTWSKGLEGMPDGWKVTSSKYTGADSSGRPVIKINYTSARGAAEVMDCVNE